MRRFSTAAANTATPSTLTLGRLDRYNAVVVAERWLKSDGLQYKNQTEAKFIGRYGAPFPMNPLFKPVPPLADATRQEIYELYKSDPETQSPLKLATRFGVSIARIQAILRLKALEAKMQKEDKPIQAQLTYHMEKMLRVDPTGKKNIKEPLRILPSERLKPLFQFIDEADGISPEDAAALLEKEPYANVQHKLDMQAERVFSLDGPDPLEATNVKSVELEKDPRVGNAKGFKFQFVDISKVEKQPMFIRDGEGLLRTASKLEVYNKRHAKTEFFM
ncbi:eukaryotic mitochondrial regulator protein-domain-containing protein [Obelidium mucronatum]|nr:eukaryotic mitochondrial regulator protein-domain-containing protein [Obelidium mucronatum]